MDGACPTYSTTLWQNRGLQANGYDGLETEVTQQESRLLAVGLSTSILNDASFTLGKMGLRYPSSVVNWLLKSVYDNETKDTKQQIRTVQW